MRWEGKPEPRFGGGEERPSWGGGWDGGTASYGGASNSGGTGGRAAGGAVRSYRETVAKTAPSRSAAGSVSAPLLELRPGDRVEHTAFGQGEVLEVKPMSGDAMVTVQFQGAEKPKRLMLKFAGSHMKKL